MINRTQLLKDLQGLLSHIEKDILDYSESNAELNAHLNAEYAEARKAERTAEHFVAWREAQITQAAVAWVLTCVFVRFLEDNLLLVEPVLSGPVTDANGKQPLQQAKERMVAYFNENPTHEERHYLLALFDQLEKFPVIAELLDHRHNPLWQMPVSADGAKRLIDFFQKIDPDSGDIEHDFTDPDWDTRFLGDLYQDLSESVRKRYALLQTPEFVESFILDYTLEPAIQTFGLKGLRLIDPTCGSGHFLLTTFERVFDQWLKREPGTNARELAQRALDVVNGVDINPYAVAICRFRLLIAAMKSAGSDKIKDAPNFHFNLACGDSLLHGRRFESTSGLQTNLLDNEDPIKHVLEVEDRDKLKDILGRRYHVVVGNPPYITVKDKALRGAYKAKYATCFREYSLGVPFTERFFDLTASSDECGTAGYLGLITTNSFMKREFGRPLIEKYLIRKDLTHIIDTSGALIPGHPTPTIILLARNQSPQADDVKAVLGIKGEPISSIEPTDGVVWASIVNNVNSNSFENEYISVTVKERSEFSKHPWSLSGGEASNILGIIESACSSKLGDFAESIGFVCITKADDVFVHEKGSLSRNNVAAEYIRPFGLGEEVRNWFHNEKLEVLFPYDTDVKTRAPSDFESAIAYMWPYREILGARKVFGGSTYKESGKTWYEFGQIPVERFKNPLSITFPFVATHNHFVLDRAGKVFKQTAPIVKLPLGTSIKDHLVLLGFLNSSVACFWGRQIFFPKGGYADGKWEERLEWDGTKLSRFPIPEPIDLTVQEGSRLLPGFQTVESISQKIDALAQEFGASLPAEVIIGSEQELIGEALEQAESKALVLRSNMISLQEELDWLSYKAYGLLDAALVYEGELPMVNAGERAFEILLARNIETNGGSDAWFERHGLSKTTKLPDSWPVEYQALVKQRMAVIESHIVINFIEKPEYKRRWFTFEWKKQENEALKKWLLSFLEAQSFNPENPQLTTCAALADSINRDIYAKAIGQRFTNNDLFAAQPLVEDLIASNHVPQMAPSRLNSTGIKKFRAWQEIWDKQRQEDAIDKEFGVDQPLSESDKDDTNKSTAFDMAKAQADKKKFDAVGTIPVPPQYKQGDFRKANYWPLRGKLDVPKERFFSMLGCEKDGDSTLVIGWAGMNHLQRAQAIAAWYLDRKEGEGWDADRLIPMLVALDELIPWLKQWHNEVDPEYGERMGDYYEGFLLEELRLLDIPRNELLKWEPPAATRTRRGARRRQQA